MMSRTLAPLIGSVKTSRCSGLSMVYYIHMRVFHPPGRNNMMVFLLACERKQKGISFARGLGRVPFDPPHTQQESRPGSCCCCRCCTCTRNVPFVVYIFLHPPFSPPLCRSSQPPEQLLRSMLGGGMTLLQTATACSCSSPVTPLSLPLSQDPAAAPAAASEVHGLAADGTSVLMLSSCTHYAGVLQWNDMQV